MARAVAVAGAGMSAHTPGPWIAASARSSVVGLPIVASCGYAIANSHQPGDEGLANARLIAAAPDLLVALQGVLRVADRKTDEFAAARAAIAKATGTA